MQLEKVELPETHAFSSFFLSYISGAAELKPFYGRAPVPDSFGEQIKEKASFSENSRKILVSALTRQYSAIKIPDTVSENIKALGSGRTFTVTTGHQLNIFTGPLYFIYKIITVINTCRRLKKEYPENHFVPVYWMASEDHDFEEISYFRLYGKKYTWQTSQTGAVGRFHTGELESILNELPGGAGIFREAYLRHTNLSDAVRYYVNALFGNEGVVVIDADDHDLKAQLTRVMQDDIVDHAIQPLVESSTGKLQALGHHTQVNAREINFFYLSGDIRERIESSGDDSFRVVGKDIRWSREDLVSQIHREPEKFSPNVILRPLYQEIILPNLAYVGGPSEVVYWLQLKDIFERTGVPFPILMPRNFAMVLDAPTIRKFSKTGLQLKDLFENKNYLFNHWTLRNSEHDLSLSDAIEKTRQIFESIRSRSVHIDVTLNQLVEAKGKQTIHQLETIEKKMLRAEKRRHSEKLGQIEAIKDSLFPGGNLQERTDNFLNFFQQNPHFLDDLANAFDPFDYRMHVLMFP